MYAFIKHIKTSMEQLPAPTQVMGYNSFEEMKLSGHYNKLLDQFKEKVADPTLDTVFKLRKMLNKLSRDKQISRVSELEKRDYGIRSIQKNSRKLDKLLRATNETKETVVAKNETELEIAKKQMDDEYDLRKDNLGKEYKENYRKLEKLIIPLLVKLAKSPEAYIHWQNRAEVIEAQLKKIVAITRG